MKRLGPGILATALLALALASPASAQFGIKEAAVEYLNEDGSAATQAGSHPFAARTTLNFNTRDEPALGFEVPDGSVKELRVSLPPGFAGNPGAVPACSSADFTAGQCPFASQLGIAEVLAGSLEETTVPVYNLTPLPGSAARLGFKALGAPINVQLRVDPDPPHNVIASVHNIPEITAFYGSTLTIWGTPADPAHDAERVCGSSCPNLGLDREPFLLMPRSCTGALETLFEIASWEDPATWVSEPVSSPGTTGCSKLEFDPQISSQPTTSSAESPSGLEFTIDVADEGITDPGGLARSDLREAIVTLPEGITPNPGSANGLEGCSQAQFEAEAPGAPACPGASKLGSVEVETPLLEGTLLRGEVFLAAPRENPFGTLFALYMVIREPQRGIFVKLPGKIEIDPETGQLKTTFGGAPYEVPQVPFSHLRFQFRAGAGAPLATPAGCGTYETRATFVPWANPTAPYTTAAKFQITSGIDGGPCPTGPAPLDPGFEGGSTSNSAGAYSPFSLRITRKDGEQDITRLDTVLPPGVTGKIAGVERCSDAAIAAAGSRDGREELASPSCPAGSEVGHVLAGAGVGSTLTYVPGKIYLAGPFAGHPLSVVVITPAVAGPFDLGTVVVREALDLDPNTAEVQVDGAASDPLPRILEGVPLALRDLRINIDREKFMLNPTSCAEKTLKATVFGSSSSVARSQRYQAADCASLAFRPKLAVRFKGGTKRTGHPAVTAVLTPRAGDANLAAATVLLPPSEFIDQGHISNPCTRVQFAANDCPAGSVLGRARAFTPLLDEPLEGPIYFRSNGGERKLPDIVLDLHGQFHIIQVGFVDSRKGRVRTRFLSAPDAPVSKLVLKLYGGKKGLLVNSEDLCKVKPVAKVHLAGHNGRRSNSNLRIRTDCKR